MNLPNDPIMLLSYINTKLRDGDDDLESLCDDLGIDISAVTDKLSAVGYSYAPELNKFI